MKSIYLYSQKIFTVAFCFLSAGALNSLHSQGCSPEALAAKYWQYRRNFNEHFVIIDRSPNGCINDGIGQDPNNPCVCSKAGYSLPATSINIANNGAESLTDRNDDDINSLFVDMDCGDVNLDGDETGNDISWDDEVHNCLDMGSETPHQMGWYWVTLATEYALLKQSGQDNEAQRTLEELFLGLQAYRRLDIQAQCLVKKRYDEITDGFETDASCIPDDPSPPFSSCLCGKRYRTKFKFNQNTGLFEEVPGKEPHNTFSTPCFPGCGFQPRTDGYSGFFLREDAMPFMEGALNDGSEDKWNIDAVKSDFINSQSPPCDNNFSQTCYLVHRQDFMSQDQMISLMLGLAFIKRYIPADATVTTCDGQTFNVLNEAVQIGNAFGNLVTGDDFDRIIWPGSNSCCGSEVSLSATEGGKLFTQAKGFKKACEYIDGVHRHSSLSENFAWNQYVHFIELLPNNSNGNFFLTLLSIGVDVPASLEHSGFDQYLFAARSSSLNKEIFPLINNLLHPEEPNFSLNPEFFESMLCSAPCGGPCSKKEDFEQGQIDSPEHPVLNPINFDCANTHNWLGQRWEGGNDHDWTRNENRQFNGLDFMALYNIYLLQFGTYGQPPYFNPDNPEGSVSNGDNISGPYAMCPGAMSTYQVIASNPPSVIQNLTWTTSNNLDILNIYAPSNADIEANSPLNPSFVQADFQEVKQVQQYYDGLPYEHDFLLGLPFQTGATYGAIDDVCDISYYKPIKVEDLQYSIESNFLFCNYYNNPSANYYYANALGPDLPGATYSWIFKDDLGGATLTSSGRNATIYCPFSLYSFQLHITLTVTIPSCGVVTVEEVHGTSSCPEQHISNEPILIVYPNPASNNITLVVSGVDNNYFNEGRQARIYRTSTGTLVKSQSMPSNSSTINVSDLSNGSYQAQLVGSTSSIVTNFTIQH